MSHWNYRIIRSVEDNVVFYGIHEVHYDDEDNITGYVEEPEIFVEDDGSGPAALRWVLDKMNSALEAEILSMEGLAELA